MMRQGQTTKVSCTHLATIFAWCLCSECHVANARYACGGDDDSGMCLMVAYQFKRRKLKAEQPL